MTTDSLWQKIADRWPDAAAAKGVLVPPVRRNGMTAALIDLCIEVTGPQREGLKAAREVIDRQAREIEYLKRCLQNLGPADTQTPNESRGE
jgi:hypothetical protein